MVFVQLVLTLPGVTQFGLGFYQGFGAGRPSRISEDFTFSPAVVAEYILGPRVA